MTTATPLPAAASRADLAEALRTLAAAAAQARDDARTRAVLAVVVQRLEDAAGAWLGDTDRDPLVVLQRRFGRAHARLAGELADHVDADLLHGLARALSPAVAAGPRPRVRQVAAAALAGC